MFKIALVLPIIKLVPTLSYLHGLCTISMVLKRRDSFRLNLSWSFLAYGVFVSAADSVLPHTQRLEAPELRGHWLPLYCSWNTITEAMKNLSPTNCLVKGRDFLFQENIIHKMLLSCRFSFNWLIQKKYLQITIYFLSHIYNHYYFGLY